MHEYAYRSRGDTATLAVLQYVHATYYGLAENELALEWTDCVSVALWPRPSSRALRLCIASLLVVHLRAKHGRRTLRNVALFVPRISQFFWSEATQVDRQNMKALSSKRISLEPGSNQRP